MADKQFISVKKAARLSGHSVREISSFCETHRSSKYVRFEDGLFRIRLDFLNKHLGITPKAAVAQVAPAAPAPEPVPAAPAGPDKSTLIALLETQLAEKDRQLAAKDTQLTQLLERNREQNNIIYSLEQSKQALETKLTLSLPERNHSERSAPVPDAPAVNYWLIGLAVLLAGVVLIILHGLLIE
jgi:hypothetical protein